MKTISALPFLFAAVAAVALTWPPPPEAVSATDAKGVRYVTQTDGRRPQWYADAIYAPRPEYPYQDRRFDHEGTGVFRVLIDLKTGTVTSVITVRSTKFASLDQAAINACSRWRWKPNTWKQVEIPVGFTTHGRGWLY